MRFYVLTNHIGARCFPLQWHCLRTSVAVMQSSNIILPFLPFASTHYFLCRMTTTANLSVRLGESIRGDTIPTWALFLNLLSAAPENLCLWLEEPRGVGFGVIFPFVLISLSLSLWFSPGFLLWPPSPYKLCAALMWRVPALFWGMVTNKPAAGIQRSYRKDEGGKTLGIKARSKQRETPSNPTAFSLLHLIHVVSFFSFQSSLFSVWQDDSTLYAAPCYLSLLGRNQSHFTSAFD